MFLSFSLFVLGGGEIGRCVTHCIASCLVLKFIVRDEVKQSSGEATLDYQTVRVETIPRLYCRSGYNIRHGPVRSWGSIGLQMWMRVDSRCFESIQQAAEMLAGLEDLDECMYSPLIHEQGGIVVACSCFAVHAMVKITPLMFASSRSSYLSFHRTGCEERVSIQNATFHSLASSSVFDFPRDMHMQAATTRREKTGKVTSDLKKSALSSYMQLLGNLLRDAAGSWPVSALRFTLHSANIDPT